MKKFKLLLLPVISIALLSGCSKQGPVGPQGIPGTDGSSGNANVTPIKDSTNSSSSWTYSTGSYYWYATFPNQYLTSSFINSGGYATVFFSTDNSPLWTPLPVTYYVDSTLSAQMTFAYSAITPNVVTIYFTWSDLKQHTDPNATYGSSCLFNVICVAPAPAAINKKPNQQPGGSNTGSVVHVSELKQANE